MLELNGKYNTAKVFTDNIDNETISQIINLLNQDFTKDSQIRIMPDCLPVNTEVLTSTGFKPIKKITMSDLIANYNEKTRTIEFCKPKNIIQRPLRIDEKMYKFYLHKNHTFFTTTENHRILTNNGVVLAKNIPTETVIKQYPFAADGITTQQLSTKYSDIEIKLICWIVGDGSISDNGYGTIRIKFAFKKQRKIQRLTKLLDEYGIEYHRGKEHRGETSITINKESSLKLLQLFPNQRKTFPNEFLFLNKNQFELVKNEIIQVDGNYENYMKNKGYVYTTTDKTSADIIQAMFTINGHMVVQKDKIRKSPHKTLYRLNIIEKSKYLYNKNGYHNTKVTKTILTDYTDNVYCIECDTSFFIMKQNGLTMITGNCHAGAGCVIGTTMTITDKIVPNLVGVDIGCQVSAVQLEETDVDLAKLDDIINKYVPAGFNVHDHAIATSNVKDIIAPINVDLAFKSLGTLGGGNHFIELNRNEDGHLWLVIHTGSRHLGLEVAKHYQDLGYKKIKSSDVKEKIDATIACLKAEGKQHDIENTIKVLKMQEPHIPKDLCYVTGQDFDDYLHDIKLAQEHATINHKTIADIIVNRMGWHITDEIHTMHNYIDVDNMILRKGSVSAQKDERLIIPINMRDGSLICIGKGNPDWNYSAPHGAGRILSRGKAKDNISMDDFKETMKGIYSTSVTESTLDEAPMAYKPMDEIVQNIQDTVEIVHVIKPIYNFKAH